jgi:hypothetical protein
MEDYGNSARVNYKTSLAGIASDSDRWFTFMFRWDQSFTGPNHDEAEEHLANFEYTSEFKCSKGAGASCLWNDKEHGT